MVRNKINKKCARSVWGSYKNENLLITSITLMNNYHQIGAHKLLKPHKGEMLNYSIWLPRCNLPSNRYFASVASVASQKQTPSVGHLSSPSWVFISPLGSRSPHWSLPGQDSISCTVPWGGRSAHRLLGVGVLWITFLFQGIWITSLLNKSPPRSHIFRLFRCQNCRSWCWSFVCIAPKH